MNIHNLYFVAEKDRKHELKLQTWSPHYQRWRCARCGAELILHTDPKAPRVEGTATTITCIRPAKQPAVTQPVLFNDTVTDDWGDSPDLRRGQKRLL